MKFPESRQLAPVRQRILGRKRQLNNIGPFDCFDHGLTITPWFRGA
jgi:hypothetical protein